MFDKVNNISRHRSISIDPAFYGRIPQRGIWVAMLLLLTSCGFNPDEFDFTRTEPAVADIIGKWIPVSDTSKVGNQPKVPKHELDLRADGSFSAVGIPTSSDVPGALPDGLLSRSGVWHVVKEHDGFTIWIINLDFANHDREPVHLRHQRPPYLIHVSNGDSDEGEPILLRRLP